MKFDYEIIKKFDCYGEQMVIVKLSHGVHVISLDEWNMIRKKLYP